MLSFKIKLGSDDRKTVEKRSETSIRERQMILQLHSEGYSYTDLSKVFKRSRTTIASIVQRSRAGRVANGRRTGRPATFNNREQRLLLQNVAKHPHKSAPTFTRELALASQKQAHPETVRRILRQNGLHGRKPRQKPLISVVNEQKRLEFARKHEKDDDAFWDRVLFSDESKFNLYGCDGRGYVWRQNNEALKKENLRPTVKHGGGNVMVWGCMSSGGVGQLVFIDEKMDRHLYRKILEENLQPSVARLGLPSDWIFQQDNDPKHTALDVKTWLLYRVPHQLHSPPQSPDLNPIEHLWDELDRRIRVPEVRCRITSKDTLKTVLREAWDDISPEVTRNLVRSMPRRLQAVIAAKGGPTKY